MEKYEKLEKTQKLKDDGILSEEEFDIEKKKNILINNNNFSIKENNKENNKTIEATTLTDNATNENNKIKLSLKNVIILIVTLIIVIIVIIGIIIKNNEKKENDGQEVVNDTNIVEEIDKEKIYITQNSEISPTKKEFIGKFSDNVKNVYENDSQNYNRFYTNTYHTLYEHIKQYSVKYYVRNMSEPVVEESYYYNDLNNNIIATKFVVNDLKSYNSALISSGYTFEDMLSIKFNASISAFMNFPNNNQDEQLISKYKELYDTLSSMDGTDNKTFVFENLRYSYNVIGNDLLLVGKGFLENNNKFEMLLLAYNEQTNAEDVIKEWESSTKNIIEVIVEKYPIEKDMICTNGTDYWLLDEKGNKIYFYDLASFEEALKACSNYVEGENETQKNIDEKYNEEDETNETSNQNEETGSMANDEENIYVEEEKPISIGDIDTSNMTFNQIKSELESRGLKVEAKTENVTVPYLDNNAGKEYCTIEDVYNEYNKGETVIVNRTVYNKGNWNITLRINVYRTVYTYKGEECYTAGTSISGLRPFNYCSFVENPTRVSDIGTFSNEGKGVRVYIDGKIVGEDTGMDIQRTFTNEEEITLKIVAPYIYLYNNSEYNGEIVDKNVTLFESTIKLKDLYEESHGYEIVDLPTK